MADHRGVPVPIVSPSIALGAFLKLANAAQSGGEAKSLIQQGAVRVNGQIELRRRRQLSPGDTISLGPGHDYVVAPRVTVTH